MANKKVSALTQLTAGASADKIPIVDTSESESKYISVEDLQDSPQSNLTASKLVSTDGDKKLISTTIVAGDGITITDAAPNLTIASVLATASNLDVDTGTETVDSFADTLGDGCIWFYVVKKSTSIRTGIIMAAWEAAGDTTEYTETSTVDIGDTSDLALAVDIDTDTVRLRATAGSDDWIVRVQRMIL